MSSRLQKLLVYIPTHTDFQQAVEQSEKIRTCSLPNELEIKVVISINGVELSPEEIQLVEKSCDELIFRHENLGGDLNINLGYLRALSENADFCWVLSANDELNLSGIKILLNKLVSLDSDMLIISFKNSGHTGILTNAFEGEGNLLPIGLISSTIYKTNKFKNSFANSLKFSWTGWGQLAVIQNALFEFGSLTYELLDEDKVYNRRSQSVASEQLKVNQFSYRHSFFGYPLIVSLLFSHNKKLKKKIIRKWLSANWYKIGFFKEGKSLNLGNAGTKYDVFWTEPLSRSAIIFSGIFSPILYVLGNLRFISKLHRFSFFRMIKKKIVPIDYLSQL
jgi:hypothetical protein